MDEYLQEIRDFINKPRKQYNLLKNQPFWFQLCSSLDVIGDSDFAIDAYINNEFPENDGEKYLRLYGVLQAIYVQQDAVINFCESLSLSTKLEEHPTLEKIRNKRNMSIGHPTKKGFKKPYSYHFISRTTITKYSFQILSYCGDKMETEDISVVEIIDEQKKYLSEMLKKVVSVLKAEEKAHKEKFKMEKLASIFENNFTYHIGKIKESIVSKSKPKGFGKVDLKQIKRILDELKKNLKKRDIEIDTYDWIKDCYELLEYPIKELESYFDKVLAKEEPMINDKTAYIFAYFIDKKMLELKEVIKEIDDYYAEEL